MNFSCFDVYEKLHCATIVDAHDLFDNCTALLKTV